MPLMPPGGAGLSFLTQSGGFGMAMSMYTNDSGLKVAKFCDCGNSAGIQAEQLIAFLADDPATRVIGLYMESVRDEKLFFDNLEVAARKKPVALCVLGRTSAGQMASQAHLGRRSNMSDLVARLPESVHVAETAQELLDACQALSFQEKAAGNRIGIVTGTGGIGSELADLATDASLQVPSFSSRLRERLATLVPEYASVANPVDVTPIWQEYPTVYPALIREINASREVDGMLISITDVPTTFPDLANALVAEGRFGRPVVVYWGSRNADLEPMSRLQMAGIPCYRSTRAAVAALAQLCRPARRT
jgi:acyl-CoA synthetase (NDP forming)